MEVPRIAYPERSDAPPKWLDRAAMTALSPVLRHWSVRRLRNQQLVQNVAAQAASVAALSDKEIPNRARDLGQQLKRAGFTDELVAKSFALVREVASRTLVQRHFDVQLIGGNILLNGMVAEMEAGEGKTLTATLAASTVALAGVPVHIITVNDYLARRDAEWMTPIYRALGLTTGIIIHGMDPDARRAAYGADIAYCSNKEIAFDYLKDRIALGRQASRVQLEVERLYSRRPRLKQLLLRGLYYGIVDEADSVLIDEARTPLIISGAGGGDESEREVYQRALHLTAAMQLGHDFIIEGRERALRLLPAGLERLTAASRFLGGVWSRRRWREELARQALTAQHLYLRDKQYLVRDEKVQIIDEYTGRVMADRSWEHGLHQIIEVKENCPLTRRIDPLARISYQRFFRRYLKLAGMTGTAAEVTRELWSVYRLATVRVPTNRPRQRQRLPERIFPTLESKWRAVADRIETLHKRGRPVLVGTRSVAASEHLSRLLADRALPHQVLNARQDETEAEIIARAGEPGCITVATNMAGRGTDIHLARGMREMGGLHVIATEIHEARRIDRQLYGRCGRQGDPGTFEAIISIEDELVQVYGQRIWKTLCVGAANRNRQWLAFAQQMAFRTAQRAAEKLHLRMRRDLLKSDEQLTSALAFSGKSE